MADTTPPPAAGTPSASALVGPYPIDEDALRKLKRLHDDGVIDDCTFKLRKAEASALTRCRGASESKTRRWTRVAGHA